MTHPLQELFAKVLRACLVYEEEAGRRYWRCRICSAEGSSPQHTSTCELAAYERELHASTELGIIWWNRLTERERAHWLQLTGSATPADAWAAFKARGP